MAKRALALFSVYRDVQRHALRIFIQKNILQKMPTIFICLNNWFWNSTHCHGSKRGYKVFDIFKWTNLLPDPPLAIIITWSIESSVYCSVPFMSRSSILYALSSSISTCAADKRNDMTICKCKRTQDWL
jgi:hypothetical protein